MPQKSLSSYLCNIVLIAVCLAIVATAISPCWADEGRQDKSSANGVEMEPIFSFGVLADVQYTDKGPVGSRYYRKAIDKFRNCIEDLKDKDLAFVIQLGDFIEGGAKASKELGDLVKIYNELGMRHYHVLGNHDFNGIDRKSFMKKTGMIKAYYYFDVAPMRFVVLDTMDISVSGGWPEQSDNYKAGKALLKKLKDAKAPNAVAWDGGMSDAQIKWLDGVLSNAEKKKLNVVVFGHLTLTPEEDVHNLWNYRDVNAILRKHECVVAYLSGHRHSGGFTRQDGVDYITLEGMVETANKTAYAVVDVYSDRLEIKGTGMVKDRTIPVGQSNNVNR